MGIARYENVTINNVTNGTDSLGEYTTTITPWFTSRAIVKDVKNSLRIAERYRVYQDLVNLTFNYTPNVKQLVDDQDLFSITWREQEWRITDVFESDDRMSITFLCYYNAPNTPV
jgi:hypothetical protein